MGLVKELEKELTKRLAIALRGKATRRIRAFFSIPIALGIFLTGTAAVCANERSMEPTGEFRRIEQPLGLKTAVTLGGLALIGAEAWWFLRKPRKVQQATARDGIQEITIVVDGGYTPDRIVVQAGQLVRLNFWRKDANPCLNEVLLPDFGIDRALPLDRTTTVEFTPAQPGEYAFTCGMRMYRGTVVVQS